MLVYQALQDVGQPRVVLRRADQGQRAQRVKRVQVGVCSMGKVSRGPTLHANPRSHTHQGWVPIRSL